MPDDAMHLRFRDSLEVAPTTRRVVGRTPVYYSTQLKDCAPRRIKRHVFSTKLAIVYEQESIYCFTSLKSTIIVLCSQLQVLWSLRTVVNPLMILNAFP